MSVKISSFEIENVKRVKAVKTDRARRLFLTQLRGLSALLMLNQSKSFQTKLPTKNRRCTYAERKTNSQLG